MPGSIFSSSSIFRAVFLANLSINRLRSSSVRGAVVIQIGANNSPVGPNQQVEFVDYFRQKIDAMFVGTRPSEIFKNGSFEPAGRRLS